MPWYVLYTNPKAEKKVAEHLNRLGVEVYCPLVTRVRQWSDRKKRITVPLFTSYLFVNIEENKRDLVFQVSGVVRYLFWLGKPGIVKDEEIAAIQEMLFRNPIADIEISNIKEGDILLIKEGPFQSHSGVVEEVSKNNIRLVLQSIGVVLTIKHSNHN